MEMMADIIPSSQSCNAREFKVRFERGADITVNLVTSYSNVKV